MADTRSHESVLARRPAILVVAALLALFTAACGSSGDAVDTAGGDDAGDNEGGSAVIGEWTIREIISEGGAVEIPEGAATTLDLDGSRASGRAACNHFEGEYRIDGGRLVATELFWTEMGCEAPLMELEQLVLGVLTESPLIEVAGVDLLITSDTVTLVFGPTPEVEPAPLVDTEWELSGFIDGQAATSRPDVERVHLVFATDGSLGGNAGCNSLRSTFVVDGDGMSIGEVAITRMSCGPTIDELEQSVLGILAEADRYEIEGGRLLVWAGDQALDLVARPVGEG